ncbi:MAG: Fic family protein [candidate division Zixibacteria bacterium]
MAGGIIDPDLLDTQNTRRTFMARGIIEEAIASSQLEGASTTRKVAKQMLQKNRKPANKSEQMILNNYQAMLHIEDKLRYEDLSLDLLLNLHITLTQGTVDIKDSGRLRRDIDQVVVSDSSNNVIYHIAPSEKFLKREIKKLIAFANDNNEKPPSIHPLIKAILLHFWIGYLHPFTDGNGRLARAIFYWYLLKKQYWGFSYLPLSRVIKRSPAQYRDAYVFSEQDDNDLTYFIDYNIRKIAQAKKEFESYIKHKQSEYPKISKKVSMKYKLNERQIQLLRSIRKEADATTTIKTHSIFNGISRVTARKDLEELEQKGFLVSQKLGKERPFSATDKTLELFS